MLVGPALARAGSGPAHDPTGRADERRPYEQKAK